MAVNKPVSWVDGHCKFVIPEQLMTKGSDASGEHDEEPNEDDVEYSDDEHEALAKKSSKKKRGHNSITAGESGMDDTSDAIAADSNGGFRYVSSLILRPCAYLMLQRPRQRSREGPREGTRETQLARSRARSGSTSLSSTATWR